MMNSQLLLKTNYAATGSSELIDSISKFKPYKIKDPAFGFMSNSANLGSRFEEPEYNFWEYGRIYDTESIFTMSIRKKHNLLTANQVSVFCKDKKLEKRAMDELSKLEINTGRSTESLVSEIALNLLMFHNVYIAKVYRMGPDGKRIIAGAFALPTETMQLKYDDRGRVKEYRQYLSMNKYVEYYPSEIWHLTYMKRTGFVIAQPPLEPVKDDIIALRRIEESVENLIYKALFPIMHVTVGTEDHPAKKLKDGTSEVELAKQYLRELDDGGGLVTSERVSISVIGSESMALRVETYLQYFKNRVYTGIGISPADLGEADATGRATGEILSKNLIDSVGSYRRTIIHFFEDTLLKELLEQSGKYVHYSLKKEDRVQMQFEVEDNDSKIKDESHSVNLYTQKVLTQEEMRTRIGLKKLKNPREAGPPEPPIQPGSAAKKGGASKQSSGSAKKPTSKPKGSGATKSRVSPKNQHSKDFETLKRLIGDGIENNISHIKLITKKMISYDDDLVFELFFADFISSISKKNRRSLIKDEDLINLVLNLSINVV
jgi:hypothetical protein